MGISFTACELTAGCRREVALASACQHLTGPRRTQAANIRRAVVRKKELIQLDAPD